MNRNRYQNATDSQFNDNWERLAQAIREIHKKNASILSFEELYRNAYNMVLHKNGDKLYEGVKRVITQHLEEVASAQIVPNFPLSGASSSSQTNPVNGVGGANFLKVLKNVWEDHITCMLMIRDILMYMVGTEKLLLLLLNFIFIIIVITISPLLSSSSSYYSIYCLSLYSSFMRKGNRNLLIRN